MKRAVKYYRIIWLRHDLPAGLAVFLVALPLCLGIALASGAPLYSGLLSGIIGGVVVSLISGSPLAVSGPAAGLTTLVAGSLAMLGDYRLFLSAVVVAGLFQVLLGLLRLGAVSNYFPSAVIKGMLAAIGIILIGKQIPIAIGYRAPDFWTDGFLQLFASGNFMKQIREVLTLTSRGAWLIALVSIALMFFLQHPAGKRFKVMPAPLAAVLLGMLLQVIWTWMGSSWELHRDQMVKLPENLFAELQFPDFSQLFSNEKIWTSGLLIGSLASLETLLCVEAIDKLDRHNRITPVNRELLAQGVGNMLAGLLGAIPMTAVVVRGAANVDAGARTKLSAFTHGLFLLLSVLLIPFLLNRIPYASLAAILLVTGYNLTKPKLYSNMWSLGLKQFLPFSITIIMILVTDLLIGVCIGLMLSVYFIIQNNFKDEYRVTHQKLQGIDTYHVHLHSNVTFLNKVNLRKLLDAMPPYCVLTIDGTNSKFIDYDILEIISEFERKAQDRHIELHLPGINRVNVSAVH